MEEGGRGGAAGVKVRCRGGASTLTQGRMYANARAKVRWGGGASALVRLRIYANARMKVRYRWGGFRQM